MHIEGLDPNFMEAGHIDLLLGASVHAQIIDGQVVKCKLGELIAFRSLGLNSLRQCLRRHSWCQLPTYYIELCRSTPSGRSSSEILDC